jgi:hypothetical protein
MPRTTSNGSASSMFASVATAKCFSGMRTMLVLGPRWAPLWATYFAPSIGQSTETQVLIGSHAAGDLCMGPHLQGRGGPDDLAVHQRLREADQVFGGGDVAATWDLWWGNAVPS